MENGKKDRLFWLHIKKNAGISARKMFGPLYVQVDRGARPPCFIQSRTEEYNDILNNFRVVLGDYQFRRCLFAKKFLYPEDFDQYLRVAFSRNPIDRCLSQFFYLWHKQGVKRKIRLRFSMAKKLHFGNIPGHDFDRFLDAIEESRESPSNFSPYGLHFQTHTAPMWPDISDDEGNCLLDMIFRVEDIRPGIDQVRESLGMQPLNDDEAAHEKKSKKAHFELSRHQKKRIEVLFEKDFDIYEGLCQRIRDT